MLDYEILKQAIKENEEQENQAEELARQKIELQRQKIALQQEQLNHKKQELERKQNQAEQTAKKSNFGIVASLFISFGTFAIMALFYIVILLRY